MSTTYHCVLCGQPVLVNGTAVVRTCQHKDEPIIASATAVVYGESKVK